MPYDLDAGNQLHALEPSNRYRVDRRLVRPEGRCS